ncbi:hypothetical protein ACLB2K_001519 [Fragaria x ananassa]
MGQNLALNIAEKGFPISVYNRTSSKIDETVHRTATEGDLPLFGQYTPKDFVLSLQRLRSVIIFVKASAPVDQAIAALSAYMEPGDAIIDDSNEWYENTKHRIHEASARGLLYLGMGTFSGLDGSANLDEDDDGSRALEREDEVFRGVLAGEREVALSGGAVDDLVDLGGGAVVDGNGGAFLGDVEGEVLAHDGKADAGECGGEELR